MKVKRPALVTVIADLSLLGAFVEIVSFFPTPKFIENTGFSFIPVSNMSEGIVRMLEVFILLMIAYGFLTLKKWAYLLIITYNFIFLAASILCTLVHNYQLFYTSHFVSSLIGLTLAFPSKRYFFGEKQTL